MNEKAMKELNSEPLDVTKIALINNNISYIQRDISDIKSSIKELTGIYVTKLQFDDAQKAVNEQIIRLNKSSNFWKWAAPTLSAVIGSVVTFLVISYIQHPH